MGNIWFYLLMKGSTTIMDEMGQGTDAGAFTEASRCVYSCS